jgi:hypothetical protein
VSSALSASFSEEVLLLSFWTVFVAEMVGDNSIHRIASLAALPLCRPVHRNHRGIRRQNAGGTAGQGACATAFLDVE